MKLKGTEAALCARPLQNHPAFGAGLTNELDHDRWRSQYEVVRDILLSAAETCVWLTLGELGTLTHFPEPSVGAQVRALRTARLGGYVVEKRRRPARRRISGVQASGDSGCHAWEYRIDLQRSRVRWNRGFRSF